jgi:F0F1-type ATP synthase delta subunit
MDKTIKDIILFYAKTNYQKYLIDNNLKIIPDEDIYKVVSLLYDDKKTHIRTFVIDTYKKLCEKNKSEFPGELVIKNILFDIFQKEEDEYIKNRISLIIKEHQETPELII